MFRYPAAVLVLLLAAAPGMAQEWARKMAETKDHDFGVVARGSDTVFKFPIKNLYKEDVVLSSVRSSCGCTSASLENPVLKTFETGYIVAKFNTRTFTGNHSATLTLQVSKPYPAQLQVRVRGNIRGDVVFEPGSVDFGQVDQGTPHEKSASISYAGRSGWTVQDVRPSSEHLEANLVQRTRNGGRVVYDLFVRLKETAPAGFVKGQVVLLTNDASNPRIPLEVAAEVRSELVIAPTTLVLGDIPQGEAVTKRVLVRGKRPFRVTDVRCEDERFAFDMSESADKKQIVTLRFTSSGKPGRLRVPITVETDLGETFTATCDVYATVSEAASTASDEGSSAITKGDDRTVLAQ